MLKHSNSPEIWLCCLLLTLSPVMCWAQIDPIAPLTESLKANVVAIRATLDGTEEKGFGFITAEQNGRLYIATAAHVVRGPDLAKTAQQIQIKFYSDISWYPATFKAHWDKEDLALLEVNRPLTIKWQPNCADLNPGSSRKVRFIGLNTNEPRWVDPGIDGNIFGDEDSKLEFSINTIRPGTSGAPLISERGIVGMITQDEGAISTALKITQIKKLFSGTGQYPYFGLQAWGGVPPEQTKKNNNTSRPPVQPQDDPYHMVQVEGGTFTMGCTSEQGSECDRDEKPSHQVTLGLFSISKYEVTQAQWRKVMGSASSSFKDCDECPVENVSWNDVQEFLRKLRAQTGKNYRLPTEAEWEFAARGGTLSQGFKYAGSNNLREVAWCTNNAVSKTHPVGQMKANELGLYDMSGNVWEWCQDSKGDYSSSAQTNPTGAESGSYFVNRGGGWDTGASGSRVSNRSSSPPESRGSSLGFRLAL